MGNQLENGQGTGRSERPPLRELESKYRRYLDSAANGTKPAELARDEGLLPQQVANFNRLNVNPGLPTLRHNPYQ